MSATVRNFTRALRAIDNCPADSLMNVAAFSPSFVDHSVLRHRSRAPSRRRRNAINEYDILDTSPEQDYDNIAMLAANVCQTKSAAISFIDDAREWFKAELGIGVRETPIGVSFCAHAIQSSELFIINDARRDPRFATNALVTGGLKLRFYAGMRIVARDGTPIAALCVIDPEPRPEGLSDSQRSSLRALAGQVQSLLELRRSVIEQKALVATEAALAKTLRHVSEHDELTGLARRGLFQERLSAALSAAKNDGSRVALMLVDIDHFKQVNDSLGHDVGDALLRSFADRLRAITRSTDTVARLGGDEFGVLLPAIHRGHEIDAIVRSLNERLQDPMEYKGRMVDCRASIGLAIYPDHAVSAENLAKCSDLALASAKIRRSTAVTFSAAMADEFKRKTKMLAIARAGIEGHNIVPFYQPQVHLGSGSVNGFEALVRCERTGKAPILPEMFALAFADRELAAAISRQMIAKILDDVREWVDLGLSFGRVAINSCAADFRADDFAERLLSEIEARGLPIGLIELEVTEGVFLGRGAHHVARALSVLSNRGMRIALDDFGTGFASLTHLKQFPVDVLKIDRSFIQGIGKNPDDTAIVRALIGLGHSLGIETVAEGIENTAQAEFVKAQGCDVGQGFLFGAAQSSDQVPMIIARLEREFQALSNKVELV